MAALLRLQRSDGLCFDVADGPGVCETCRERPPIGDRGWPACYCSALCADFDAALSALVAAYACCDCDRTAPAVLVARAKLRAAAAAYDAEWLGA